MLYNLARAGYDIMEIRPHLFPSEAVRFSSESMPESQEKGVRIMLREHVHRNGNEASEPTHSIEDAETAETIGEADIET